MVTPKVSVIVPVYNSHAYLEECIDSVLHQSLQDFEIICIDDGSTDDSGLILKEYSTEHDCIKVLSQINKGVSNARNAGLKVAQGEYIFFLDSDDYIEPDTFKCLCQEMDNKVLDVVYFDTIAFGEEGIPQKDIDDKNKYYSVTHKYSSICSGVDFLYQLIDNQEFSCPVWKQMIRRELLNKNQIWFYDGIIHEDELFTVQTMLNAERVLYKACVFHHRRLRKNSIMSEKPGFNSVYGYFVSSKEIYKYITERGYSQEKLKKLFNRVRGVNTNARKQYSKLDEKEQKKQNLLPEEDKIMFQLTVSSYADILKQKDLSEKQLAELEKKAAELLQANTETVKKLNDTEGILAKVQETGRKQLAELEKKAAELLQANTETVKKLNDTEGILAKVQETGRKQLAELEKKVAELLQENAETTKKLSETEGILDKERETGRKRLAELEKKAAELLLANTETTKKLSEQKSRFDKESENNRKKIDALQKNENRLNRELNNVKTGWSFKTGRVITFVPRKIRDLFKK